MGVPTRLLNEVSDLGGLEAVGVVDDVPDAELLTQLRDLDHSAGNGHSLACECACVIAGGDGSRAYLSGARGAKQLVVETTHKTFSGP